MSGHKPEIIFVRFPRLRECRFPPKQRPLFRVAAVGFVGSFPSRRGCCRRVPVRSVLCHGQCSAGSDHRQQFLFGDEAYAQFGRLLEFGRSDLFSCDQKIDVGRYRREVFTAVRFDQFLQFVAAVTGESARDDEFLPARLSDSRALFAASVCSPALRSRSMIRRSPRRRSSR